MTSSIKSLIVQVVGIGLALGLLYLALRNVDFGGMWDALETAKVIAKINHEIEATTERAAAENDGGWRLIRA